MKKIMVVLAVLVMMLFAGNAFADRPGQGPGNCGEGLIGLEIAGSSAIGAQIYTGETMTFSSHDSCFNNSASFDRTGYIGVNLMSSANGSACLTTERNAGGNVYGNGTFKSGIEGSILGVDFYTNSRVKISGGTR